MLRQGAPAPEFASAEAMRAHYRAVHSRLWAPPIRRVEPKPETARSIAVAQYERRLREQREEESGRLEAALAARTAMDELVFQVLDPEQLAREPKRIITRVAQAFGLTHADLVGPRRTLPVIRARFAAIAAMREAHPRMSVKALGRHFGRDHTTILHAIRKMERAGVPSPPLRSPGCDRIPVALDRLRDPDPADRADRAGDRTDPGPRRGDAADAPEAGRGDDEALIPDEHDGTSSVTRLERHDRREAA